MNHPFCCSLQNFIRFLTRVEEDEEMYGRGWLNNNKLLGPFEFAPCDVKTKKPRGATRIFSHWEKKEDPTTNKKNWTAIAVGSSSSRQGQVLPEQGLTTILRANQQVYGAKAEVKLYFEEYRDMMMKAACPPLHLYGAKGLKRYNKQTNTSSTFQSHPIFVVIIHTSIYSTFTNNRHT